MDASNSTAVERAFQRPIMKRMLLAIFVSLFTIGSISAETARESEAVGSDGKGSWRAQQGQAS
jgi:hypothetical protein